MTTLRGVSLTKHGAMARLVLREGHEKSATQSAVMLKLIVVSIFPMNPLCLNEGLVKKLVPRNQEAVASQLAQLFDEAWLNVGRKPVTGGFACLSELSCARD